MEKKNCPFSSGSTRYPCMASECNLWINNECVFIGMIKKLDELIPEIKAIRRRVEIL